MVLWANYDKLFRAFRQNNNYRFGLLSKDGYIIKPTKNIVAVPLIDGVLYLFKHQTKKEALEEALNNSLTDHHQFIKKNLKHLNQSIKLELYTVRYNEKLKKAVIQPNKKYLKFLIRELHKTTHTKYPYRRIWFGKVNRIMKYIKRLKENSFMTNEQERTIQYKARKWIVEGLTSIYHLKKKEAKVILRGLGKTPS